MKTTLYIKASKAYSWSEDYVEGQKYSLELSQSKTTFEHSWVVGSFEVECPIELPEEDHIVDCQVRGLEEVLKDHIADSYKKRVELEKQIADLLCLTHED